MSGKYTIGGHEFGSREEWENAVNDLKMIKYIMKNKDIHDTKQALQIYNLICSGKLVLKSEVGETFFQEISRIAGKTQGKPFSELKEYNKQRNENNKKINAAKENVEGSGKADGARKAFHRKNNRNSNKKTGKSVARRTIYRMIGITCIAAAILCLSFFVKEKYNEAVAVRQVEEAKQAKDISQAVNWYFSRVNREDSGDQKSDAGTYDRSDMESSAAGKINSSDENAVNENKDSTAEHGNNENKEQPQEYTILPEYTTLHDQYPDLCGWLKIEGTQIDYPVMQAQDNEIYLHSNMDGEEDINGTLFMDYRADPKEQSTNVIIYGHNMKSGAMFGGLKNYLEQDFVNEHKTIQFDTIYEKQTYEVIAVCRSQVGYQDEQGFRYYDFIQAESEEQLLEFQDYITGYAVYNNIDHISMEDRLLTLSTCSNYVEDGRLFVVARKLAKGE